jgi:uncharacterized protein YfkK (UPF0435 family)
MLNMKDVRILVLKAKLETLNVNALNDNTIKDLLIVLGVSHEDLVYIYDDLKSKMIEEQMKSIIENRTK